MRDTDDIATATNGISRAGPPEYWYPSGTDVRPPATPEAARPVSRRAQLNPPRVFLRASRPALPVEDAVEPPPRDPARDDASLRGGEDQPIPRPAGAVAEAGAPFRLTEQSYPADAPAGTVISEIVDDEPAASYRIVGEIGGLYVIDGRRIRRSGRAVRHTGRWHAIAICQTLGGRVGTRLHAFWIAPPGEDRLSGRLSIWSDYDECYQGERIETVLEGLTEREEGLYHITSTWDDETELFTSLPADHPGRIAGGVQIKPIRIHCPDTPGTRTVTYRVYRPGQTAPALTISKSIEVRPLSSIPAAFTYVASRGGDFAGAPAGRQFRGGSSVNDAMQAAYARNTSEPVVIYLKSGDVYAPGEVPRVEFTTRKRDAARRILVRVWGGGTRPVLHIGAGDTGGGWDLGGAGIQDTSYDYCRLSIRGLEIVGRFDAYTITDPALDDGRGNNGITHVPEDMVLSANTRMHLTLNDCKTRGLARAITSVGSYASPCVYNCIVDEWSVYGAIYAARAEGGGLVGSRIEKTGLQPSVLKAQFKAERAPNDGSRASEISLNGPGRNARTRRFAIIRCEMSSFHGWSPGNNSPQVDALYGYDLPKFQTLYRCASSSAEPGFRFQITGNRFEGWIDFTKGGSAEMVHGRILICDNHWIWNGDVTGGMAMAYWGAWICSNTIIVADAIPLHSNALGLIGAPSDRSGSASDPHAHEHGEFVLGNTIVDLRTDANLRGNDDGTIARMFEGMSREGVESHGNVLCIPNREVTETPPDGITLLTRLDDLDQTVVAQAKFAGILCAGIEEHSPYQVPTLRAEFATPQDSGISARPLADSVLLGAWDASDTDLVPVGRDGPYAGSSRAPGAYATAG